MRALRFELKGETACFRKPDVNVYAYFTYSHIHKVALFGLLGAVLGLGGYQQQYEENYPLARGRKQAERLRVFPEFYEVLRNARVGIVPHGDRGYFTKKLQIFNNTVGYASQEEGRVLNVQEQWLEKPHWTIYIADDDGLPAGVFDRLEEQLRSKQSVFMPYLGKNDHPAAILNAGLVQDWRPAEQPLHIDSLHQAGQISYDDRGKPRGRKGIAFFKELMPCGLNEANNGYVMETYVLTNQEIEPDSLTEHEQSRLYEDRDGTVPRTVYLI